MVGRVWPRHGHRGRPLNSVVRTHLQHRGINLGLRLAQNQIGIPRLHAVSWARASVRSIGSQIRRSVLPRQTQEQPWHSQRT